MNGQVFTYNNNNSNLVPRPNSKGHVFGKTKETVPQVFGALSIYTVTSFLALNLKFGVTYLYKYFVMLYSRRGCSPLF